LQISSDVLRVHRVDAAGALPALAARPLWGRPLSAARGAWAPRFRQPSGAGRVGPRGSGSI